MRILLACCLAMLPLLAQDEKEADKVKSKFIGDLNAIDAGRVLFANGCAACHGAAALGGRGPDLTNIAAMRAVPQSHDAIVDPDAEISTGYSSVSVSLKNGKTLRGVARNRTNYSLQLQEANGNLHLLSMNDVTKITLTK